MSEKLTIQSIETDNRITVEFSDKYLPRHARHGELFVVNGILYIFADLNDNNQGKWFPLTNEKQIFTYSTNVESEIWEIPIDFQTDNIQVIVYDDLGRIYPHNFDVNITEKKVTIIFDRPTMGEVYLIINTAFDWVDRRFIVGNKNFAVTEDTTDPDVYFIEIDTKYVEILKNGNVTFRSDVIIEGSTTFIGEQTLNGNVSIGGDLDIQGKTTINKSLIVNESTLIEANLDVNGITILNDDTTINGNLNFNTTSTGITWNILDSEASVKFYKNETVDTPRRLEFQVANEDNEFFSWVNAGVEKMTLKSGILDVSEGITINGKDISLNDHNHDTLYLALIGGTISGNVIINGTMSATEIIETSSIRFKENVKPIEHAYETISKLQGVTYNWKETGKEDIGFIAEEVDKILPQLVDKNEDGIVNGMNYSKLTALLVEVVKNQQKQIDELKKLIK